MLGLAIMAYASMFFSLHSLVTVSCGVPVKNMMEPRNPIARSCDPSSTPFISGISKSVIKRAAGLHEATDSRYFSKVSLPLSEGIDFTSNLPNTNPRVAKQVRSSSV